MSDKTEKEVQVKRNIREYFSHIINGVDLLYKGIQSKKMSITVTLLEFFFYKKEEDFEHIFSSVVRDERVTFIEADDYLEDLRQWDMGYAFDAKYDHAMLFTGHNLYDNELMNNGVIGRSYIGHVCDIGERTAIVEIGDFFQTVSTAAHELGHNLGAHHDGEKSAVDCPADDMYIMSPNKPVFEKDKDYSRKPWLFSNCSMKTIKRTLKRNNQAEMAHTCRGTINLATAFIHTEDSCTIVISNGGTQTFHLKATSEVERQKWITALELAKADAIRMLEPDSDDDIETSTDKNEIQNTLKALTSKLEDLNTCNDLIGKHGSGLQRALSELEHLNSQTEIVSQIKIVNERATMFRITSNAMINACSEYLDLAQTQGRRWQKMLQHEHEQRLKLEEMLEQLAKDQVSLEIKARKSLNRGESQGLSGGSDEEDFQDALDYHEVVTLPEKQGAEKGLHRRSDSDVSGSIITDDQYSTESDIEESELGHDREAHVYTAKAKKGKHKRVSSEDKTDGHPTDNMEDRGTVARLTKTSGQRQRRTMISPKPNYSLNLWSIMKNCIGQELSKIPMPVNFSEPLSMLQRLMEDLEYSSCLDHAARCEDSTEQLAHVAAFTVSAYSTTTNRSTKPFNPLLGETFECDRMDDLGWRSVAEQVSHHPPSAAICTEGRGWKLWLDFTMGSKFRGKYLQIIPMGIAHLEFEKTGHHYTWRKVTTTVHNIIVGKLWVDNHGEMDIVNHTTKDRCHLKYNAYSYFSREKPRKVTAVVTDAKDTPKWVLTGTWDERMDVAQVLHVDESGKRPTFATGPYRMIWKRNPILPGSEKMYYFTSFAIELNEPEEGVAPTDSRNRPDQRLMEEGNWDEANKVKMQLEEKQRAKRKQREAAAEEVAKRGEAFDGGHKPVWFEKQKDPITGNIIHVFNNKYWENKKSQDWSICPDIFI